MARVRKVESVDQFKSVQNVEDATWLVRRRGIIDEVEDWDGRLKYRVIVHDVGREPFINRLFANRASAEDFYDRVRSNTEVPG